MNFIVYKTVNMCLYNCKYGHLLCTNGLLVLIWTFSMNNIANKFI